MYTTYRDRESQSPHFTKLTRTKNHTDERTIAYRTQINIWPAPKQARRSNLDPGILS